MKLYLNVVSMNITVADACVKLLVFYDILLTFKNFENVDKSDFEEVKS